MAVAPGICRLACTAAERTCWALPSVQGAHHWSEHTTGLDTQPASMGIWKLVIEICLPIPVTLIVALLLPAPRRVIG